MNVASVVIPAHNESGVLPATLNRIAEDSLAAIARGRRRRQQLQRRDRRRRPRLPAPGARPRRRRDRHPRQDQRAQPRRRGGQRVPAHLPGRRHRARPRGPRGHGATGLSVSSPVAGSPDIRFDLDGADLWVREYYRMFERLPYVTDGLVGLGVYGLSEQGRDRFDEFPDVLADDLYIQRLFAPEERLRTRGQFAVRAPRRWADLVKVRTRVDRGNAQLATSAPTVGPRRGVRAHLRLLDEGDGALGRGRSRPARRRRRLRRHDGGGEGPLAVLQRPCLGTRRVDPAGALPASPDTDRAVSPWATPRVEVDDLPFSSQSEDEVVDSVFHALGSGPRRSDRHARTSTSCRPSGASPSCATWCGRPTSSSPTACRSCGRASCSAPRCPSASPVPTWCGRWPAGQRRRVAASTCWAASPASHSAPGRRSPSATPT